MRVRTATVALTVSLGLATLASVANAALGSYRSGPLTAWFSASTTRPNCKQLWPVTVTARYNGRATHASAYYQFLYNGQVVSTRQVFSGTRRNPHNRLYYFYSSFYDNTFGPFGALAVGHRLGVRAVVKAYGHTAYPGLYVTVTNARGCRASR